MNGTKVKRCKAELTLHNMHRECSVHITALYAHSDMTISNVLGLRLHKEAFKTVLGLTGNTLVGKIGTSLGWGGEKSSTETSFLKKNQIFSIFFKRASNFLARYARPIFCVQHSFGKPSPLTGLRVAGSPKGACSPRRATRAYPFAILCWVCKQISPWQIKFLQDVARFACNSHNWSCTANEHYYPMELTRW